MQKRDYAGHEKEKATNGGSGCFYKVMFDRWEENCRDAGQQQAASADALQTRAEEGGKPCVGTVYARSRHITSRVPYVVLYHSIAVRPVKHAHCIACKHTGMGAG